ncbi:P-loop ATPase, Sll1717 family [Kocuria palustris]|uniref:P-loop ATPase, Sll1717 family n=1 Tax=Kocuria palustris TaxID=71999 RepID=UPI001C9316AC|nr:hypothetical protein [Kocuria palustris]
MTLGNIDFGGVDAESDVSLNDYFVTTPYVRSAFEGRRTQFLGRKGSGKSALFLQIPRLAKDRDERIVAISRSPDHYAWAALSEYKEQMLSSEHAHTNAWKFTLIIEGASELIRSGENWRGEAADSAKMFKKFLQDNFETLEPGILKSATSVLKGISSFNLSAFGFGAGLSREEQARHPVTPHVLSAFVDALGPMVRQRQLIISLDRLDDSWDGSEESRSLLVGLLKAAKDLNDRLRGREIASGLRVNVFLRSDIYDNLEFDDKDKHRQLEESIAWSPDLLKEMVNVRLPDGISIEDIFEPGEMRGSISPFNYIVKRTFLRPREVIQFLDECVNTSGRDSVEISKDEIRSAEERYSKWKVDDLRQEFNKAFPDFGRLLECLRQERHRYDSLEDLERLIEKKDPELFEKYGSRRLLETLFDYSVIGVRIAN